METREHETGVGSIGAAGIASAACVCGWVRLVPFCRPTGEPVALRLALVHARRHESGADELAEE